MNRQTSSQASTRVVNSIAALTDNRDISLLETSLLKTVTDIFSPEWCAIYHSDTDQLSTFSVAMRGRLGVSTPFPEPMETLVRAPHVSTFPILNHSFRVLGYLLIKRTPPLSETECKFMTDLVRVYDNYLAVLRDSQLDRLTGLLNRHTFDAQLESALQLIRESYKKEKSKTAKRKAMKSNGSFFLGSLDIDHFKKINDTFGHLYGDEVLIIFARLLKECFRKTDLLYRFGGEEFIVIVCVEDQNAAEATFERLRHQIENHDFPQVGRVTVSIGVTQIKNSSVPVELLGHADQALYYAKNNGRNRVCFYENLIASHDVAVPPKSNELTLF